MAEAWKSKMNYSIAIIVIGKDPVQVLNKFFLLRACLMDMMGRMAKLMSKPMRIKIQNPSFPPEQLGLGNPSSA